jgi:hypothetical protein
MIHLVPFTMAKRLLPYAEHTFQQIKGVPQPNSIPGRLILRASPDSKDVWSCWSIDRDRRTGRFAALRDWLSPLGMPSLPRYDLAGERIRQDIDLPDRMCLPRLANALWNINFRCSLTFVHAVGSGWWKLPEWLVLLSWQHSGGYARLWYTERGIDEPSFGHSPMTPSGAKSVLRPAPTEPICIGFEAHTRKPILQDRAAYVARLWRQSQ